MRDVWRSPVRGAFIALVVGLMIASMGACGSDDDASENGTSTKPADSGTISAKATSTFEQYSKPIDTFVGDPAEPVDPPAGKSLTIITCGAQGITCVRVANGARAAAQALGYNAKVVDGQSNPSVWNSAIRNAVAAKTDGIVLAAVSAPLVKGALEAAGQANIPVAATLVTSGEGLDVKVNYDRSKVAIGNAAFVAKDSGGEADVLLLTDFAEFPDLTIDKELWPKELEAACNGNCHVAKEVEFTLALASQRLAGDVAQALRADPKIKYVSQPFDTITPFVQQGIRQSGRTGDVKIVGVGADPPSVKGIEAGDTVESLGTPAEWMGWQAVDGLVRLMAGKTLPPLQKAGNTNYEVPVRYITEENKPGPEGWQGDFDYQSAFKKLWGR